MQEITPFGRANIIAIYRGFPHEKEDIFIDNSVFGSFNIMLL